MSQTFISVLPSSARVLVASSERGMTTFINYGSEIIWLGDGIPAVIGEGISINPNGGSYVMASGLGNLSFDDIYAIHGGSGPQQLCINQEAPVGKNNVRAYFIGVLANGPLVVGTGNDEGGIPVINLTQSADIVLGDGGTSLTFPTEGMYLYILNVFVRWQGTASADWPEVDFILKSPLENIAMNPPMPPTTFAPLTFTLSIIRPHTAGFKHTFLVFNNDPVGNFVVDWIDFYVQYVGPL